VAKRTQTVEPAQVTSRVRPGRPPRQGRAFASLTWASILGQVRNVSTLVFGFIFPLAFISVFGLFNSTGPTKVNLGVVNGTDTTTPVYQALSYVQDHPSDQLKLTLTLGSQDALTTKLSHGDLDGVLTITPATRTVVVPPGVPSPTALPTATGTPGAAGSQGGQPTPRTIAGYDVTLVTSLASPQGAAAAQGVVGGIANQVNLRMAGLTTLPVQLSTSSVQGTKFSYIDFILPGMLGFSLLSIAIFGTAFGFVVLKQTLVLKRIFATPTRPTTIVLAQGAARLLIAVLQVVVILLAGIYLPFINYHLADGAATFAQMLVVALFGLVTFLGMGLIIAGNFRDENAMGPVINLVTMPQFLLGGTFFPTDSFPAWIKPLADNMPLSYLNVALRDIASQGASLWDVRGQLLGLTVWGVITYAVAIKTFKWE
jgi:ABC-2 type transport system permease protein